MFKTGDIVKLKNGSSRKFKVKEMWYNYWNDEMYVLESLVDPSVKFSDFKRYVDVDYILVENMNEKD